MKMACVGVFETNTFQTESVKTAYDELDYNFVNIFISKRASKLAVNRLHFSCSKGNYFTSLESTE